MYSYEKTETSNASKKGYRGTLDVLAESPELQIGVAGIFHDIELFFCFLVLKAFSDAEHPMKISEIDEKVQYLMSKFEVDDTSKKKSNTKRSISRRFMALEAFSDVSMAFDSIDDIYQGEPDDDINFAFFVCCKFLQLIFGGTIQRVDDGKSMKRYYFAPFLSSGHVELLKGSLITNQYLSDSERNYILSAIQGLDMRLRDDTKDDIPDLTELLRDLPHYDDIHNRFVESEGFRMLNHINTLHYAIQNGIKVRLVHGSYEGLDDKKHPILIPAHNGKQYLLNPHALLTSNGHQYLLATQERDSIPKGETARVFHFRVDRIASVELVQDIKGKPAKQDRIADLPLSFRSYWSKGKFNQNLYIQSNPTMTYSATPTFVEVILEGPASAVATIVDGLGRENVTHHRTIPATETTRTLYQVKVRASLDPLARFCSQQHEHITIVNSNTEDSNILIEKVRAALLASLTKYN